MKKLKLDLQHLQNAEVLTKSQLKNVLGGDPVVTPQPCQNYKQSCNSVNHSNCCSGLVCANYICLLPTI